MTDHNPYIVIDILTFEKMLECLVIARKMAEKSYPHMVEDYNRVINMAKAKAESFVGSQNKPKVRKAF